MTAKDWNEAYKPTECMVEAEDGDIVEQIGNILFLCQRKGNYNNIVCFNKYNQSNTANVRSMFVFAILLLEKYGIKIVRVEGNLKRYNFLVKIFGAPTIFKDESIKNRNVFYCNIELGLQKLKELIC